MVDKAVSIAESWITQQNIPELEQTAFAVLANPVLSYQVAFKYNINISAFNKNQCKIVKVSMDLLEVGWEQDTDQQISPNMIPIEKNNTSKVGGSYKLKMTSSVINNEAPGLGSYLVLAPANNPMKSVNPANQTSPSTNSNEKMLSQVQKDQEEDDLVELEEQWIGKWYDETHERYIVRTEDGAYRDIPLDDSATFPPYTRFRVRTPPVLVSPTTGREPIEIDVKTSHPTQRFLLIQRAPDIVTIYLVHDTSKHWDIKVRSKRGGNVILATFFTSSENDIVLISSNGIEIYSFLELKKQWKRTLTHKRTIGNCWVLPKEQMILVSGTLPPVARGFPVDCVTLQVQTKKKQKIVDHSIVKYPKFSLDSSVVNNAPSVHLCRLYNRIYCVAIDHSNMKLNVIDVAGPNGLTNSLLSSSNTAAYSQNMDDKQTISVARSFPLYGEGQMYMSVVDNLLLIHVPAIKVTLVYDIASDGDRPVANPMSLVFAQNDQNSEKNTNVLTTETKENENSPYFDPYDVKVCRPVWPHYFIEIKKSHRRSSSLGLMNSLNTTKDVWSLRVNLVEALRCSFGSSPGVVAGFLMRRIDDGYISKSAQQKRLKEGKNNIPGTYAKELLLSELLSSARQSVDLGKLVSAFNVLCSVYRIALTERTRQLGNNTVKNKNGKSDSSEGMVECMDESSAVLAEEHNIFVSNSITENTEGKTNLRRRVSMVAQTSSNQSIRTKCGRVVVLQRDVFKQILQPMMIDSSINDDWTYAVMFEYLRSLQRFRIPEAFQLLLSMGKHRHAVQLLQYRVPPDSLRLARMLLECERTHDKHDITTKRALVQAAMDMMMRLKAYHDLVIELLKRHRLMTAMRVVLRHRERFAMENAWKEHGSTSGLSTMEQGVPKESFFRTAVALLRENAGVNKGGKLEIFHAVYAFYRELWPHLLQPILKEASAVSSNPMSPLAATLPFPNDLFDDFRVADMYRSLFGFSPSKAK